MWRRCLAPWAVALFLTGIGAAASELEALQGELFLRRDDGGVLHGEALAGANLLVGQGGTSRRLRIDTIDRAAAGDASILLYTLSVEDPSSRQRRLLCRPDASGRRGAIPLSAPDRSVRFTCSSGAEGKCILLGYPPWGSAPMPALHRACIHLVRADYGGDGRPATEDGRLIHVYDRFGIRPFRPGTGMTFEAAWSTAGAVCVARTRRRHLADLKTLAARYPHLHGRLGMRRCSEARMRRRPETLLFNLSRDLDPKARKTGVIRHGG